MIVGFVIVVVRRMNSQYTNSQYGESAHKWWRQRKAASWTTLANRRLIRSARRTHIYNFQSTNNNVTTINRDYSKYTPILNENNLIFSTKYIHGKITVACTNSLNKEYIIKTPVWFRRTCINRSICQNILYV